MVNIKHLFIGILSTTMFTIIANQYTPKNTIISMDLDDVVLVKDSKMKWEIFKQSFSFNPVKLISRIKALIKIKKLSKNNRLEAMGVINSVMSMVNPRNKKDLQRAAHIIHAITMRRKLVPGTLHILRHLKKKGYTIHFGTNKERLAYDAIARKLGSQLTNLADHVIVAEPSLPKQLIENYRRIMHEKRTPLALKNYLHKKLTSKETATIHHASSAKPHIGFAHKQREIADRHFKGEHNPYIIFFDDKKANTDSVNKNKDKKMIARQFTNPIQFAHNLVQLGILSESTDKSLLNSIGYIQAKKKNKKQWKKILRKRV